MTSSINVIDQFNGASGNDKSNYSLRQTMHPVSRLEIEFTFQFGFHLGFDRVGGIFRSVFLLIALLFGDVVGRVTPLEQLEEFAFLTRYDRFRQLAILLAYGEIRLAFLLLRWNGRSRCRR